MNGSTEWWLGLLKKNGSVLEQELSLPTGPTAPNGIDRVP
jgi:hypothetical protein